MGTLSPRPEWGRGDWNEQSRNSPEPARQWVHGQLLTMTGRLLSSSSSSSSKPNLQVNTRWKALAEIYTMLSFALFSNLNFFVKIAEFFADFYKMLQNLLHLGKIPKTFSKILQNSSKSCKTNIKIRKQFSNFNEKIEIRERCKGVHCVDLGESFPTSIYLQNLASIQPRTSLFNFFNFNPALAI